MVILDMIVKENVILIVGFWKNVIEKLGSVVVVVRLDGRDYDVIKVYCLYLIFLCLKWVIYVFGFI